MTERTQTTGQGGGYCNNAALPLACFRRTRLASDWRMECDRCGLLIPTIEAVEASWMPLEEANAK